MTRVLESWYHAMKNVHVEASTMQRSSWQVWLNVANKIFLSDYHSGFNVATECTLKKIAYVKKKLNIKLLAQSPLTLRHLSYLGTSLCIPSSYHVAARLFNQHPSRLHLRRVYQQGGPSFLETGKCQTVPGPDCTEDARRYPNGIAHVARLVSAGQYADVHCCATEPFHESACLFGKKT